MAIQFDTSLYSLIIFCRLDKGKKWQKSAQNVMLRILTPSNSVAIAGHNFLQPGEYLPLTLRLS